MAKDDLRRFSRRLPTDSLERIRSARGLPPDLAQSVETVTREAGGASKPVDIGAFRELMTQFSPVDWPSRTESDAWLAPRVHATLRLTRREAADRMVWAYLANAVTPEYVQWRWLGKTGTVAENRFDGAVNKQALARLWWGAELFRNGPDYAPVELLFANQDFPNSYLHRVFVRNRPLALAVVGAMRAALPPPTQPSSDQINDVARKVNLWIAPLSIEAATALYVQDSTAYAAWVRETLPATDFAKPPVGPPDGTVPEAAAAAALEIAAEICKLAELGV